MSVFVLKWIGVCSMLIDHLAVALFAFLPEEGYMLMRTIGRIAFPIFAFMIANGCRHTRSRKKYLLRLLLFGLVSQLPYVMLIKTYEPNVMFDLAAGVAMICLIERFRAGDRRGLCAAGIAALSVCSLMLGYGPLGLILILVFYFVHGKTYRTLLTTFILFLLYYPFGEDAYPLFLFSALSSLVFIGLYNGLSGRGGRVAKYAFYLIYPLHLSLFWGLQAVLNRYIV